MIKRNSSLAWFHNWTAKTTCMSEHQWLGRCRRNQFYSCRLKLNNFLFLLFPLSCWTCKFFRIWGCYFPFQRRHNFVVEFGKLRHASYDLRAIRTKTYMFMRHTRHERLDEHLIFGYLRTCWSNVVIIFVDWIPEQNKVVKRRQRFLVSCDGVIASWVRRTSEVWHCL